MKKLYTLTLSAALAVSASAAVTLQPMQPTMPLKAKQVKTEASVKAVRPTAIPGAKPMAKAPAKADAEWTSLGEGTMVECFFSEALNGTEATLAVEIESDGAGNYRINEPFKNLDMTQYAGYTYDASKAEPMVMHVDGNYFYFDDFSTGVLDASGNNLAVITNLGSLCASYGCDLVNQVYPGGAGLYNAGGSFTYPDAFQDDDGMYYNILMAESKDGAAFAGCNGDGTFCIKLPGAKDYSVSLGVADCADDNKIAVEWTCGADVAAVKYYNLEGAYQPTASNLAVIAQYGNDGPLSISATLDFSTATAYSKQTFFVVALDADGNVVGGESAVFFIVPNEDDKWVDCGTGKYTEAIIDGYYTGISCDPYEVTVQKHVSDPGRFRVVNPYADNYPYKSYSFHTCSHNHYLYVNAADPEKVYVEESVIGLNLGDGMGYVLSYAEYLKENKAEEAEYTPYYGKLEGDVVTMPANSLIYGESGYKYGSLAMVNQSGNFKLELPVGAGVSDIIASDNAEGPMQFFNLQGQPVSNPAAGQLVIKRQGGKASKVLVK